MAVSTHVISGITLGVLVLWFTGALLFRLAAMSCFICAAGLLAVGDCSLGSALRGRLRRSLLPEGVRTVFSQRRAVILERQAELEARMGRPLGDAGRELVAHVTRDRKQYG